MGQQQQQQEKKIMQRMQSQAVKKLKNATTEDTTIVTPVKIEKLVELFKTHYCALDIDWGFINAMFIKVK